MRRLALLAAWLIAVLVAGVAPALRAQRLDVSGGGTVTIGDPVTVVLRATLPAGAIIEDLPHPRDSLASTIRLIGVDTVRRPGDGALLYRARIAFYQTGSLTSPAFALTYRMPAREALDSVVSGAVLVTVLPTLPDTATAMRDIRAFAPLGADGRSRWWLIVIAVLLAAAVAAVALRSRGRSAARRAPPAPPIPAPTAYDAARARLDAIRRADWAAIDVERHYDETADVIRRYLEDAFDVPAVHRTTSELRRALPGALRGGGPGRDVIALLGEADLVKYARLRPDPRTARAFLDRTDALVARWPAAAAAPVPAPPRDHTPEAHDAVR